MSQETTEQRFEKSIKAKFKNLVNSGLVYNSEGEIDCEMVEKFFLSHFEAELQAHTDRVVEELMEVREKNNKGKHHGSITSGVILGIDTSIQIVKTTK